MISVNQLGYIGVGVSNVGEWERFATQLLGMQLKERASDGTLFLKMDSYHHRIAIHPGGKDDISYIGWQVKDDDEMEAMAQQLKTGGVETRYGTPEEARKRHVAGLIKMEDPTGIPTEVYYGPEVGYNDFRSPRNITGFATGNLGLGHVVLAVKDFEKSLNFYRRLLGLKASDPISRGQGTGAAFMHANPRHHTFAFRQASQPDEGEQPYGNPGPRKRFQHLMIQLQSLDDVGSTYYLAQQWGLAFSKELGRHNNDHMVSSYFMTPSGFAIEYGWGAREVDDAIWQVSQWGSTPWEHPQHTPPATIREKPIVSSSFTSADERRGRG
jgi:2,3-dihydroxyethylbenzene 1,2-dioxygenase